MNRQEILTIVKTSIFEETSIANDFPINEETTAAQVPGWDSLAHVRIMLSIEMELDKEVPIESTYKTRNIGDLVSLFQA